MIKSRPGRLLLHITIVVLAITTLAACHFRKGMTFEDSWNELLDSMVPKTARSQSVAAESSAADVDHQAQHKAEPPPSTAAVPARTNHMLEPPPRAAVLPLPPNSDLIGQLYAVTAVNEDTLFDIARRYDLGISEIQAANPTIDRWLPRAGTKVVLPDRHVLPDTPREGIVLNLASMRLFYYPKVTEGESPTVITYPVGIGRQGWKTPQGLAKITQKRANPAWTVPQSIRAEHAAAGDPLPAVVAAGPNNPLGSYAMRLSMPGYLIHGTNKPDGVGMRVSHGCVRLYPEDIEALFKKTPVGTPVRIIHQPYLAGWDQGTLYFEAFAPPEEKQATEKSRERIRKVIEKAMNDAPGDPPNIDWDRVDGLVQNPRGIPVAITVGAPNLDLMIAALPVFYTQDATPEEIARVEEQPEPSADSQHNPETEATPQPTPQIETKPAIPHGQQQTTPAAEKIQTGWYVQVGSFKNRSNAEKLATKIRTDLGLKIAGESTSPGGLHRVLAGPFETRDEAEQSATLIESSLGGSTLILTMDRL